MLALVVAIGDDHIVAVFAREIGVDLFDAHHLLALKGIGLRSAKDGAGHGAALAIVVVSYEHRGVVVMAEQEATDMPLDAAHGVEAATEQGHPRRGAMAVLIGIAVQQIEYTLVVFVTGEMELATQGICGYTIDGEHVDIDTSEVVEMKALDEGGRSILDLTEGQGVGAVVLGTDELEGLGQPLAAVGDELFVVGARHGDVDIVVPRDETLVAHGSKLGSRPDVIAQLVLTAATVYGHEDAEDTLVEQIDVVVGHGLQ